MTSTPIWQWSAVETAEAIRARRTSAEAVVEPTRRACTPPIPR